jgi:hypothetical protein
MRIRFFEQKHPQTPILVTIYRKKGVWGKALFSLRNPEWPQENVFRRKFFSGGKQGSQTPDKHCYLTHKKRVRKRLFSEVESTVKVKRPFFFFCFLPCLNLACAEAR